MKGAVLNGILSLAYASLVGIFVSANLLARKLLCSAKLRCTLSRSKLMLSFFLL